MCESDSGWACLSDDKTQVRLYELAETLPVTVPAFASEAEWLESSVPLLLRCLDGRLVMQASDTALGAPLAVDFTSGTTGYRVQQNVRAELLVKAVLGRAKGTMPSVLDATAGLGRDSFLLATAGCQVSIYERHAAVFLLLKDGLSRAEPYSDVVSRLKLCAGDVVQQLDLPCADVVYMDPMFPLRHKQAQVKKAMQVFHHLVGPDTDAEALFHAVWPLAKRKLVVKRPRHAPTVISRPMPSSVIEGKTSRFDVYVATRPRHLPR